MGIHNEFEVRTIPEKQTHEWLRKKHYANRIPIIIHSFGIYDQDLTIQGVCTYGPPARMLNDGYGIFGNRYKVTVFELNRLVINEDLPKNILSFFVAATFKLLPRPVCLVSYADSTVGHHGYIYQATNWLFTGMTATELMYHNKHTGETIHPRTVVQMFGTRKHNELPDWIEISKESSGKYRYVKFLGSKREVKMMRSLMVYLIEPYPKGDNQRYDASYEPAVQNCLF